MAHVTLPDWIPFLHVVIVNHCNATARERAGSHTRVNYEGGDDKVNAKVDAVRPKKEEKRRMWMLRDGRKENPTHYRP